MRFHGSFVALVTPFDKKGRLDTKTLERLVEWHIAEGTDGIVCSATTGEGPTLSDTDRKKNAEVCIRTAGKRIPIIVATGINDTKTSIRYTEMAQKQGADGCLVVTPYYNKPSQRGCILHFQEIAKVGLPVILYHNPGRAVIRLNSETILELAQNSSIVGIKDSSRDLDLISKISKQISVFSGDDDLVCETIRAGGIGSIVPTANIIPRGWKQMVNYCLKGNWKEAEALAQKYLPLTKALYLETNPQAVKFAASWLGQCKPVLRLPMLLASETTQAAVKIEILKIALPQFNFKGSASLI